MKGEILKHKEREMYELLDQVNTHKVFMKEDVKLACDEFLEMIKYKLTRYEDYANIVKELRIAFGDCYDNE